MPGLCLSPEALETGANSRQSTEAVLLLLQRLGDKTAARNLAIEAGVKVVPGTSEPVPGVEAAKAFAAEAGYPVMLKAAMGGGGRGMRVVRRYAPLSLPLTPRCRLSWPQSFVVCFDALAYNGPGCCGWSPCHPCTPIATLMPAAAVIAAECLGGGYFLVVG